MNKDVGMIMPVVFHTARYLNFGGFDHDPQKASHWYHGKILRQGVRDALDKPQRAKRVMFTGPVSDPVLDRIIYLFADHDLATGTPRVHVCAVLHADAAGHVTFMERTAAVDSHAEYSAAITIPQVIDRQKVRYFAIASKVQISTDDVDTWIEAFAAAPSPDQRSNAEYQIGYADFTYLHTFLGFEDIEITIGTDENGEPMNETAKALRFPVLDPLEMALKHASKLSRFLVQYEKEFGFGKTLVNHSAAHVSDEVAKWAKYRLAVTLSTTRVGALRSKVDDLRGGGLWAYLRGRTLTQESYQAAVDLAAGNLAGWLQRDVVLAWINVCHSSGAAVASTVDSEGRGLADGAKVCVLHDFGRAIRDLHQTRPGNMLAEMLHQRAPTYVVLDEYLFSGKPMKTALKVRSSISQVVAIKKLVLGRLIARGKVSFVETLKQQGGYLTDADLLDDVDDIYTRESQFLRRLVKGNRSTLSDENLALETIDIRVSKMTARLGSAEAASGVLSMLGWFSVMDSIHTYSELHRKGKTKLTDDLSVTAAITAQSLATAELVLGDQLKQASKIGLKVSLSALGVVVNVVDAGLKAKEADELLKKGDTDAGLLTMASAVMIIYSIPFAIAGIWIGPALAIVAGVLGIIATFLTDDTWDTFLKNTEFGIEAGGGSAAPDWAGVTLDALRENPAQQVRALANLLNNFTVKRLGGGTGKRFGTFTLVIDMASPDPLAVFVLVWRFRVSGESEVQTRTTVVSTFGSFAKPADGKRLQIPGEIRGPDGKTSIKTFESAAVDVVAGSGTAIKVGDPLDMRAHMVPFHPWERRTITGVSVRVQRLAMQSFGRPRSKDREWFPSVELNIGALHEEARLFNDT